MDKANKSLYKIILGFHSSLISIFHSEDNTRNREHIGIILTCTYIWFLEIFHSAIIGVFVTFFICIIATIFNVFILSISNKGLISFLTLKRAFILSSIILLNLINIDAGIFSGSSTLVWMTSIPVLSIMLLNIKEGALWSILSAIICFSLLLGNYSFDLISSNFNEQQLFWSTSINQITAPLLFFIMFGFSHLQRADSEQRLKTSALNLKSEKKEKEKLLTVLFHDLGRNTSLLSGYLELSGQKTLDQKSKEKVFQLSEEIKAILQNAKELDSQKTEAHKEELRLLESFNTLKSKFESKLKEKNLSFVLKSSKDLSLTVNKSQFNNQVLGNLLSNAIKFSHSGSKIFFKAREHRGKIVIKIENTGLGYTDNSVKDGTLGEKGTGQGLKIVQEFSKMNHLLFEIYQDGEKTISKLVSNKLN